MSIRHRIEEAELLWRAGKKEGAWVSALIATAATARRRYPRPLGDAQAFKQFICDIAPQIVSGKMAPEGPIYIRFYDDERSRNRKMEDIFYNELRCNLIHEAELREIGFSDSQIVDGKLVADLHVPASGFGTIPDFWVLHLIGAVKHAPENADLWPTPTGW